MKAAIYALSADPPHNGHLWVIEKAAGLVDELTVAIGNNTDKQCKFTMADRLELLSACTAHLPNVKVLSYPKMFLVDFARKSGISVLIRGIRGQGDFGYERALQDFNEKTWPDCVTLYLSPPYQYSYISSTLVKGMVGLHNWEQHVAPLVPSVVLERLKYASLR